jgi:hypothetical protein
VAADNGKEDFCPLEEAIIFLSVLLHNQQHNILSSHIAQCHFDFKMRLNLLPAQFPSITPSELAAVAREVFQPKRKWNENKTLKRIDQEICRSLLGTSYEVSAELWNLIDPQSTISRYAQPKHLLWALILMKNYSTEEVSSRVVGGVDKETFRDWCWVFITAISGLKSDVVSFMSRRIRIEYFVSLCIYIPDCF